MLSRKRRLRQAGRSYVRFTQLEAMLSLITGKHHSISLARLGAFGPFPAHPFSDGHSATSGQSLYLPFQILSPYSCQGLQQ
jgi:hypothetical protein